MGNTLYGHTTIKRVCIDCDKPFYGNKYDPGSVRCPVCRMKKYHADEVKLLNKLVRENLAKKEKQI